MSAFTARHELRIAKRISGRTVPSHAHLRWTASPPSFEPEANLHRPNNPPITNLCHGYNDPPQIRSRPIDSHLQERGLSSGR